MFDRIWQRSVSFLPPLWLSLLLGGALRFACLGDESIWVDEGETFRVAVSDENLLQTAGSDPHPLSFYFLYRVLSPWILQSDFWFRVPSAVASCLALGFAALFLHRLALDRRLVAWSFAAFACLPASIRYAQEARAYALAQCFAFLALAALASTLQTASKKNLVLLAASIALCAHVDGFGLAICGSILLFVLWKFLRREVSFRIPASVGAGSMLAAPYYAMRIHYFLQAEKFDELSYAKWSLMRTLDLLVQLSPIALGTERLGAIGLDTFWTWPLALWLIFACIAGACAPRSDCARDTRVLCGLLALLPLFVFSVLTRLTGMEFLEVRYLLVIVPGFIPLLALGVLRAQKFFALAPQLALGFLPLVVSGTSLVQSNVTEDWKGLYAQIARQIEPGDLFVHEQIKNYTQLGISPIRAYAFQHGAPIDAKQCLDYRVREPVAPAAPTRAEAARDAKSATQDDSAHAAERDSTQVNATRKRPLSLARDRAYFENPEALEAALLHATPNTSTQRAHRVWTLSSRYSTYQNLDLHAYASLEGEWHSRAVTARLWILEKPSTPHQK